MRVAILGNKGLLGTCVERHLRKATGHDCYSFDLPEVDISDKESISSTLNQIMPEAIINCAAYSQVDKAESDVISCFNANVTGVHNLAFWSLHNDALLFHFSSDYVFPGKDSSQYTELDELDGQSVYGISKELADRMLEALEGRLKYYTFRISLLFGPDGNNLIDTIIQLAQTSETLHMVCDQHSAPTYTQSIANLVCLFLDYYETGNPFHFGVYNAASRGGTTPKDLCYLLISLYRKLGLTPELKVKINEITTAQWESISKVKLAKRPAFSVLSTEKLQMALQEKGVNPRGFIKTFQQEVESYLETKKEAKK